MGRTTRVLLFLLGALLWTWLACYPNPIVFFRNLARYRHLPVEPGLAHRMRWQVPARVKELEPFVNGLLLPVPDWQLYRVPWYIPTPVEAARAGAGDCEAKAVILASLLQSRGIPFQVRASFYHLWLDYPGRLPRPGESDDAAYLVEKQGKLSFRWPRRVDWREAFLAQKAQLWDAMPAVRKATWIYGLVWLVLAALLGGRPAPRSDLTSDWRTPIGSYAIRALALSAIAVLVIVIAAFISRGGHLPSVFPPPETGYEGWTPHGPAGADEGAWTTAEIGETVAYCLVLGSLLAWLSVLRARLGVSVADGGLPGEGLPGQGPPVQGLPAQGLPEQGLPGQGSRIKVCSVLGPVRRERELMVGEIAYLLLETSPGGLRPWLTSAVLADGERIAVLRHRWELAARAALRQLAATISRPMVVRGDGAETRTKPEELGISLAARPSPGEERSAERPPLVSPPQPAYSALRVTETEGRWELGYEPVARGESRALLGCVSIPATLTILATAVVLYRAKTVVAHLLWIATASLLAMIIYLALVWRGEVLARLAGAHVEIAGGELRFHPVAGAIHSLPLRHIESVELGRLGDTPTIAVVSPDKVVHIPAFGTREERVWMAEAIEQAITRFVDKPPCGP